MQIDKPAMAAMAPAGQGKQAEAAAGGGGGREAVGAPHRGPPGAAALGVRPAQGAAQAGQVGGVIGSNTG